MYSTDKFCKALEEVLKERVNSGRRGELTIELPEKYTIPVSGKPNPWDYVEDIRPILRLSEKSLRLILEAHLELLTGIEEIEDILQKNNIPLPDKSVLQHFIYDRDKPVARGEKEPGWGDFENTEYLSIIL